jgi:hypothetical protein
MSTLHAVDRDERTVAVENASYRWAYLVLTYALLVDVMFRSLARGEASWDLMAMVFAGGAVCALYQVRHRILAHGWVMKVLLTASIAGVIAVATAALMAR